eukprot:6192204-Pleurochrysis_carterae.AAC.1
MRFQGRAKTNVRTRVCEREGEGRGWGLEPVSPRRNGLLRVQGSASLLSTAKMVASCASSASTEVVRPSHAPAFAANRHL